MHFHVEHFGLPASDPVSLKDWYVRVLGGEVVFSSGQAPWAFFVRLPGLTLEIYTAVEQAEATRRNGTAGWRHLALQVASLDQAILDLESRGALFTDEIKPAGGGGRVRFFSDPEGNLLHLVERPDGSPFMIPRS